MIVARGLMLIQLVSIFPLLMYILRSQFLQIFTADPSRLPYYDCIRHTVNLFCCFCFVIIAIKVSWGLISFFAEIVLRWKCSKSHIRSIVLPCWLFSR